MTLSADSVGSLLFFLGSAAFIGKALTMLVMPLLEQLGILFAQEEACETPQPAAGDQRSVASSPQEPLASQPERTCRVWRGWAATVPLAGWWLAASNRPAGWHAAAWLEFLAVVIGGWAWWWEVACGMQLPLAFVELEAARELLPARLLAHLILAGFLAAATWCDLRYRVIPDVITVPGFLLGTLAITCWPGLLLPVACVLPLEPARSLAVPDLLGVAGPLICQGQLGWWLDVRSWLGLVLLVGGFVLWWSVGTAADPHRRWYRDPRSFVLACGLVLIITTWGMAAAEPPTHLLALTTSLTGAVGAGGLIVLTREAASRALGKEAMGLGDATLMAMVGSWLGWQVGVLAFFMAAFLGLGHGVLGWLRRRETELAFGPSLALATVLILLGWRWVWAWVEPIFLYPLDLLIVLGVVVGLTGLTLAVWGRLRGLGGG